ncbi:MAG: hypothetical protein FWH03_00470 [Firmicutes bacterium]|nr:hypothetical protein [Bacillota bacterium]
MTGYLTFSIIVAACAACGAVCAVCAARLVKRQLKLNRSITLIALRSTKAHYIVCMSILFTALVFTVLTLAGAFPFEFDLLLTAYGMTRWQIYAALGSLAALLLCAEFLLTVLCCAKSAVVDRGVYAALNYLDWYHVHDYIIDESKGVVVLSADKATFSVTKGMTAPLRVKKDDIPKLKFILNKNKNKFSGV